MWGSVRSSSSSAGSARSSSRARRSDAAIAELERTRQGDGVAGRDVAQRNAAERQPARGRPFGQPPALRPWRAPKPGGRLRAAEQAAARAGERRQWYKVTFNELWARLAVLEEACLAQWGGDRCAGVRPNLEAHITRANQLWIPLRLLP